MMQCRDDTDHRGLAWPFPLLGGSHRPAEFDIKDARCTCGDDECLDGPHALSRNIVRVGRELDSGYGRGPVGRDQSTGVKW